MLHRRKRDFPLSRIRHYLEPGPVVLVSSAWRARTNVMTMNWHTMMEFTPALIGCVIAETNCSFELIRRSGQCVINLPTVEMLDIVAGIGNCSGSEVDKFARFGLTPHRASQVEAPLIDECHANFECRLHDRRLVKDYNYFIFECVKAHVLPRPRFPRTAHYTGDGVFMIAGKTKSRRALFRPDRL